MVKKKIKKLKKPEVHPVIGQYDTSLETIEGSIKRKEALTKRKEELIRTRVITGNAFRFFTPIRHNKIYDHDYIEKGYNAKYLGPGCYVIPREFESSSFKYQGNVFISKGERFKGNRSNIPGPGHYQKNEVNPWNKKTFNLLFNNNEYQL